jgi:mono/diheme cytochrome c family protein
MPTGSANLVHGKDLYQHNCEPCHGADGSGSHGEGAPLSSILTPAVVYATADGGRKSMPSFHGVLTPEDLRDVAHFIAEQLVKH